MNKLGKPLPASGLDAAAHDEGMGLKQTAQGVALLLRPGAGLVRLHGLSFLAREGPSVVIGRRKHAVEGVY